MDMLTTGSRQNLAFIRDPLTALLDDYNSRTATDNPPEPAALEAIRTEWTSEREGREGSLMEVLPGQILRCAELGR